MKAIAFALLSLLPVLAARAGDLPGKPLPPAEPYYAVNIADAQGQPWRIHPNHHGIVDSTAGGMQWLFCGGLLAVDGQEVHAIQRLWKPDAVEARQQDDGSVLFRFTLDSGLRITRWIALNKPQGLLAGIDLLENTTPRDLSVTTDWRAFMPTGKIDALDAATTGRCGYITTSHLGGVVVQVYGDQGRGQIKQRIGANNQGVSIGTSEVALKLAPRQTVAFAHVMCSAADAAAGARLARSLSWRDLLKDAPQWMRRGIVNIDYGRGVALPAIERDAALDRVTVGSARSTGTVKTDSFTIDTAIGQLVVPSRLIAAIALTGERGHGAMLLRDGQVLAGTVATPAIVLETEGKTARLVLDRGSQIAFRKAAGDVEEWPADRPCLVTTAGDVIGLQSPLPKLELTSRYGPLSMPLEIVASIERASATNDLHRLVLADGSRLSGTLRDAQLAIRRSGTTRPTTLPAHLVQSIESTPRSPTSRPASLACRGGDVLVGRITGVVTVRTDAEPTRIDGSQVQQLTPVANSPGVFTVTMGDGTIVRGRPAEAAIPLRTESGLLVSVSTELVESYNNAEPDPSEALRKVIKKLLDDLDADDFSTRESAQKKLTALGPVVVSSLRSARPGASPEVQQRIDLILKTLVTPPK